MELKDTVELMTSTDYKERFMAEYSQLVIRIKKLEKFINLIKAPDHCAVEGRFNVPKHDCSVYLLSEQLEVMERYAKILRLRAVIENVDL